MRSTTIAVLGLAASLAAAAQEAAETTFDKTTRHEDAAFAQLRAAFFVDPALAVAWNQTVNEIAFAEDQFFTFKGVRAHAIMHIAIHDALNAVFPLYGQYAFRGIELFAHPIAAAAQAAHDVALAQYPGQKASGGAVRRVRPDQTAVPTRDAAFVANFMGDWRDPRETPRHVAWVRNAWDRLAPYSTGAVYLNYLGQEERDAESLVQSAFGSNYDRLTGIKTKYDPANFFRLNQNIKPEPV